MSTEVSKIIRNSVEYKKCVFDELEWEVPNGPTVEFVDLGLSVKWAKYNLGATHGDTAASWYGDYYQWGSTEVANKKLCDDYDAPWQTEDFKFTKYVPASSIYDWAGPGDPDNKLVLDAIDDPATSLGRNWHTPTESELRELLDTTKVTSVWVNNYNGISGLNGIEFTSLINGNKLFIPAAGTRSSGKVVDTGERAYLLSSSLDSAPSNIWSLYFVQSNIYIGNMFRYDGLSVRPVRTAN